MSNQLENLISKKEEIQKKFPQYELISAPLSLSVACHIGPGSLAITCTKKVSL